MNFDKGRIRAILGPTNTGKTYLAVERMLAHATGMIGFPLRLLARENYDRIVASKGILSVALITGEEKIIPPNPRWYVCTVEAMPIDKTVDFLAIDEIQLCADMDRGHVFTDRLLYARGIYETMLLGSDSIKGILQTLIDGVEIETRERFSSLTYKGPQKLTRLPRRSAIVAFSVNEVYAIAETIRRQRGGTAVVLGALSPRTRNAQIEMYQAGEVDYLVATDAIGMGLNMDVDHVAFAATRKFDGRRTRFLEKQEVGQIAGRAGRHMNDGSFGVSNNLPDFDADVVEAVENHKFQPITHIQWRNHNLNFKSPKLLIKSLQYAPPKQMMMRTGDADDHKVLMALMREEKVLLRADTYDRVQLLWDICQVPDFRKVLPDHHAELLGQLFIHLADDGRLPEDWVVKQINRLDRVDGEIDMLTQRLANVRTWSYIAHRGSWLEDNQHWQERARLIEEKLSDALHESLMQRFVDKRAAKLGRRREADDEPLLSAVKSNGEVVVEGHITGMMEGLSFIPLEAVDAKEAKTLAAVASAAIQMEAVRRAHLITTLADKDIRLAPNGMMTWGGIDIAFLSKGDGLLKPIVRLLPCDLMENTVREKLQTHLSGWVTRYIGNTISPLVTVPKAEISQAAKGLLFLLQENLGALQTLNAKQQIKGLSDIDRKALASHGVRFGVEWVFVDGILSPKAIRLKSILWATFYTQKIIAMPAKPKNSLPVDFIDTRAWPYLGYRICGPLAVRFDRFEGLMAQVRRLSKDTSFPLTDELAQLAGCSITELARVLLGCECLKVKGKEGDEFKLKRNNKYIKKIKPKDKKAMVKNIKGKKERKVQVNPDSPFAILKNLVKAS